MFLFPCKPGITAEIWAHDVEELKEGDNMAKLEGYNMVAVVEQNTYSGAKDYYFALYDDGTSYKVGDKVYVSGNGTDKIVTIKDFMDPVIARESYVKNITAEVICKVDTSAYDKRVEQRKEAEKLKRKMYTMIKQMDETKKYEMYAAENPELKEMLNKFKELKGK